MCLGQLALIATATWYVVLAYPIIFAIIWVIQRFYLRTSRQLRFLDLEAKSPLYTHFLETLSGLVTIRAFGWQHHSKDKGLDLLDDSQRPYYLLMMIQRWLSLVLDLTIAGLAIVVVGLAIGLSRRDGGGGVSAGFAAVALVNLISLGSNVKVLVVCWTLAETSMGALVRIKQYEHDFRSEDEEGVPPVEPPSEWPVTGDIKIRNITAAYNEYRFFHQVLWYFPTRF